MTVLKNSLLYLVGTGLGRGLPFLLLPVLTRHLSVADYGRLSLATTVSGLLAIVIGFNPHLFVFAHFFKHDRPALARRLFNILLVSLVSCIPVLAAHVFFSRDLGISEHIPLGLFTVLVVIGLGRAVAGMHLAVDQMEGRAVSYFFFYLLTAALVAGPVLTLVSGGYLSWRSVLFAEAGALVSLNTLYLVRLARRGYLVFEADASAAREFTRFSAPMIAHVLALWIISFVDRAIIVAWAGVDAVGSYTVAHTVALGLSLVHESIHRAWQPGFYRAMQAGGRRGVIGLAGRYQLATLASAALYFLLARTLLRMFLPSAYGEAFHFLPFLIAGFSLLGLYRFSAGYFYHYDDTRTLSMVTVCCGGLHVVLVLMLVSFFGARGAAYAAVFSYLALWLAVAILARRRYGARGDEAR